MKNSRLLLLLVTLACAGLLAFALYLQVVERMAPCPWCIIQRYAFVVIGLTCLIFAFMPAGTASVGAGFGCMIALAGAAAAGWHVWIKAHPETSCGIDPVETSLNRIPTADLFPLLFKADGLCTTPYDPILGLSIPQWALAWFLLFALLLGTIALRRAR